MNYIAYLTIAFALFLSNVKAHAEEIAAPAAAVTTTQSVLKGRNIRVEPLGAHATYIHGTFFNPTNHDMENPNLKIQILDADGKVLEVREVGLRRLEANTAFRVMEVVDSRAKGYRIVHEETVANK